MISAAVINSGFGAGSVAPRPNGVAEVHRPDSGKTGRTATRMMLSGRVSRRFQAARTTAPTCEYPVPPALPSTSQPLLSSPEICPDLRKRHSEEGVHVLPWIATEGVPVT